ncbi:hypothetical protein OAL13_00060 [bacterium]|nr:hypothetical protein [bacterium]
MTTIPANKVLTPQQRRAAMSAGWFFVFTGLVSPGALLIYAWRQQTWSYAYAWFALFAISALGSGLEGGTWKAYKISSQLLTAAVATVVAVKNKEEAQKELGIVLETTSSDQ